MMSDTLLRALVDLYQKQIQKGRIQFGNRVDALERGADDAQESGQYETAKYYREVMWDLEKRLKVDIEDRVEIYSVYPNMLNVRGIGPITAARLLCMIDIERTHTVSGLWKLAGLAVIDGKIQRKTKGETLSYNERLKTTALYIGKLFIMQGDKSPYKDIYDASRNMYLIRAQESEDPKKEWPPIRQHKMATRRMVKVFLSHLYVQWRTLEGLPVRKPYVHEKLGHTSYHKPEDFGWPKLA